MSEHKYKKHLRRWSTGNVLAYYETSQQQQDFRSIRQRKPRSRVQQRSCGSRPSQEEGRRRALALARGRPSVPRGGAGGRGLGRYCPSRGGPAPAGREAPSRCPACAPPCMLSSAPLQYRPSAPQACRRKKKKGRQSQAGVIMMTSFTSSKERPGASSEL